LYAHTTVDIANAAPAQVESPYEVKSEHSQKTQDNKSDGGSDEDSNKTGNPFETMDDD